MNQLRGAGLSDALHDVAGSATAAAGQAARATTSVAQTIASTGYRAAGDRHASAATSGRSKLLYWALPAAAVVALLLYLFNKPAEQVAQQVPQTTGAVQNLTADGLDIGKQVNDSLASLRTSLQGVTDAASATAAQAKLQQITAQLDKIVGRARTIFVRSAQASRRTRWSGNADTEPTFRQVAGNPGRR